MPTTHRTPGETFAGYTQLETTVCANCGVMFALPEFLMESRRADGQNLYCPNGHTLSFHETVAQKLERQLEAERRRSGRLAAERDQTAARLSAQRGVTTKLKKRIANGVCPCCNRSFQNLSRHIAGQHPDYAEVAPQ